MNKPLRMINCYGPDVTSRDTWCGRLVAQHQICYVTTPVDKHVESVYEIQVSICVWALPHPPPAQPGGGGGAQGCKHFRQGLCMKNIYRYSIYDTNLLYTYYICRRGRKCAPLLWLRGCHTSQFLHDARHAKTVACGVELNVLTNSAIPSSKET